MAAISTHHSSLVFRTSTKGRPSHTKAVTTHRKRLSLFVTAQSKGFSSGGSDSSSGRKKSIAKKGALGELRELSGLADGGEGAAIACPCGGGEERKAYKDCCGRYHGGVREPDAVTLMKARYTAFAKAVIPYLVRTTHPDNPDLQRDPENGRQQLAADCEETCSRVLFKRLDILDSRPGPSVDEAFVSFRAVYAFRHGTTRANQVLLETSRFVQEGGEGEARWLYREKMPMDAAAEAAWRLLPAEAEEQQASEAAERRRGSPAVRVGRAQPGLKPRSR